VAKATPQVKWETVIEVVKPSHFRPRNEFRSDNRRDVRPRREGPHRDDRDRRERRGGRDVPAREISAYTSHESSGGGTFADFIRASEERKKRDEEKRKNKK